MDSRHLGPLKPDYTSRARLRYLVLSLILGHKPKAPEN